jgi:peptide/nickel transport system substrate-binding protein
MVHAQDYEVDQITWALPSLPETLFIPHAWSTGNGAIMSLVQEGMLAFADDLSLTEGVASSWEFVDPTTVRFILREGVTFSDGTPLTSEDVVATMRYHMDDASGSQLATFYNNVLSVEANGDQEVVVNLSEPSVQFQYTPAHMSGFVFEASQLSVGVDTLGSPDNLPLGTGPYEVVEFEPGESVTLKARDDYWGETPVVGEITIVAIPDAQSRFLAMRSGEIDGTFNLPVSDVDQWKSVSDIDIVTAPSLATVIVSMDTTTAPFDDIHVRRAVAHLVDRDGLVNALLTGNGEALAAVNPPEMWAGVLSASEAREFYSELPEYDFSLELAAEELAKSAHPDGFDITVPVSNARPELVTTLQSLGQNLSQIGINLTIQELDHNQWLAQYFRHEDLGMQVMVYYPDYADPANYPYLFLHGDNAEQDGMNAANYNNPQVDALIDKANSESDPSVRAEALKEMFRIAQEDLPVVSAFTPYSVMAISSDYKMSGFNAFWYNVPWAMRGFSLAD